MKRWIFLFAILAGLLMELPVHSQEQVALSPVHNAQTFQIALVGVFVVLGYFLVAWYLVGRGAARGTVIPRYTPPSDCSPAVMHYLRNRCCDAKTLAVAILSAAVKGHLLIAESDHVFTIERTFSQHPSPRDTVLKELRSGTSLDMTTLAQHAGVTPKQCHEIVTNLQGQGKQIEVKDDVVHMTALDTTVTAPRAPLSSEEEVLLNNLFSTYGDIFLFDHTNYMQVQQAISSLAEALDGQYQGSYILTNIPAFVPGAAISLIFTVVLWYRTLFQGGNPLTLLIFTGIYIALCMQFYKFLRALTPQGRKLLDEAEGFRMYLQIADEDGPDTENTA